MNHLLVLLENEFELVDQFDQLIYMIFSFINLKSNKAFDGKMFANYLKLIVDLINSGDSGSFREKLMRNSSTLSQIKEEEDCLKHPLKACGISFDHRHTMSDEDQMYENEDDEFMKDERNEMREENKNKRRDKVNEEMTRIN